MTKPEKKFQAGGVSASIFRNERKVNGKTVVSYSVIVDRTYRDRGENWQRTNSYKLNDLHKLIVVAQKAFEHLTLKDDYEFVPGGLD